MEYGGPPEKWAATQCLALSGVITYKIIVELISQLHADNAVRTEKAGNLLAQLSQQSVRRSHLSYTAINVCIQLVFKDGGFKRASECSRNGFHSI